LIYTLQMSESRSNTQSKIKTLEEQYNELNSDLKDAVKRVHDNEHSIVACLQTLMPLQNSYLTGIITNLQQQVSQMKREQQQFQQSIAPPPAQHMPPNTQEYENNIDVGNDMEMPPDNSTNTNNNMPSANVAPPRRRRRMSHG
jgi:chromosome segregation ATPase